MPYFWIFLLLGLAYYDTLRKLALNTKTLKCRYLLYALRDELREQVIARKVNSQNWVFQYLDSSLAKTISALGEVTIWHAFALYRMHRNDPRVTRAIQQLHNELQKPQNAPLEQIYKSYQKILGNYLLRRHPISLGIVLSNWLTYLLITEYLREEVARLKAAWRRAVKMFTEVPETSTLYKFSHGGLT